MQTIQRQKVGYWNLSGDWGRSSKEVLAVGNNGGGKISCSFFGDILKFLTIWVHGNNSREASFWLSRRRAAPSLSDVAPNANLDQGLYIYILMCARIEWLVSWLIGYVTRRRRACLSIFSASLRFSDWLETSNMKPFAIRKSHLTLSKVSIREQGQRR